MPRSNRSTQAAGSASQTMRITRSQTARLQAVAPQQRQDPEPTDINWLFFDKSRSPTCFKVKIPNNLLQESFQECCQLFVDELGKRHGFQAAFHSIRFWKPNEQIPIDTFDKDEWPETFTNVKAIAKTIQGAMYLCDVFQGELDRQLVHLIVTAERAVKTHKEAQDEITGLPEIIYFRKNIDYKGPSPSKGAKSQNYVEIQRKSVGAIYDGRHPHDGNPTTAAPINIFHPVFEAFVRRLQHPEQPTRKYLKSVRMLMDVLTQIRRPELRRSSEIRKALQELLHWTFILDANDDDTRTDGNIVIIINGVHIRLCFMELKVEVGEGGCDASTEVGLSVRAFWVNQENFFPIRDKTCCPTLVLAGGGAWLAVLGAVFTDRPIVQRLTDMLWMGNSTTHREDRLLHLAHVFLALRAGINDLNNYYTDVGNNTALQPVDMKSNDPHPRFFPYITSVDAPMGRIEFKYLGRLQDDASCVTFHAKRTDNSKDIVVKFVTTYNVQVHELLHQNGYAPALLYHGPIPTAGTILEKIPLPDDTGARFRRLLPLMNMVIMDYIEPVAWPASREDAHEQLTAVLKLLHDEGYVFGDLRQPNVLFTKEGRLNLIDFDWAGLFKQGSPDGNEDSPVDDKYAHYPAGLSKNINWAKGVDDFAPIRPEHDQQMMNQLLDAVYPVH